MRLRGAGVSRPFSTLELSASCSLEMNSTAHITGMWIMSFPQDPPLKGSREGASAVPQKGRSPGGTVTREGAWGRDRLGIKKTSRQTPSSTEWPYDHLVLRVSVTSTPRVLFRDGKLPASHVSSRASQGKGSNNSQTNRHSCGHGPFHPKSKVSAKDQVQQKSGVLLNPANYSLG